MTKIKINHFLQKFDEERSFKEFNIFNELLEPQPKSFNVKSYLNDVLKSQSGSITKSKKKDLTNDEKFSEEINLVINNLNDVLNKTNTMRLE